MLNLGAGVQSTALFLMFINGEIGEKLDFAAFADTQEEPQGVYRHLDWLRSLGGPPILTDTAGKLGDDLINGKNSSGQRFASIPAFTSATPGVTGGMLRRQCTSEYKINVVERIIRRQVVGLEPRRRCGGGRGEPRHPPGGGEAARGQEGFRAAAQALGGGAFVRLDGTLPPVGAGL